MVKLANTAFIYHHQIQTRAVRVPHSRGQTSEAWRWLVPAAQPYLWACEVLGRRAVLRGDLCASARLWRSGSGKQRGQLAGVLAPSRMDSRSDAADRMYALEKENIELKRKNNSLVKALKKWVASQRASARLSLVPHLSHAVMVWLSRMTVQHNRLKHEALQGE